MRELDSIAIVGAGRLGAVLVAALQGAGVDVSGPHGRGSDGDGRDVVLLCVPDGEIAAAAAAVPVREGRLVGHCSGAATLAVLGGHEAFSVHPLMTVPAGAAPCVLAGAGCAVAGATPRALAVACALADALGMRATEVADEHRVAYHAAASIAANYLVTLEGAAERLASTAGVDRARLAPLVRAAVENWAASGARTALTGPVVRGDEGTVAAQRAAVAARAPDLLPLFDALTEATRSLVAGGESAVAAGDDPAATGGGRRGLAGGPR